MFTGQPAEIVYNNPLPASEASTWPAMKTPVCNVLEFRSMTIGRPFYPRHAQHFMRRDSAACICQNIATNIFGLLIREFSINHILQ